MENRPLTCKVIFAYFLKELGHIIGYTQARGLINATFRKIGEQLANNISCNNELECIRKVLDLIKQMDGIQEYTIYNDGNSYIVETVGIVGKMLKDEGVDIHMCVDEPIAGLIAGMLKKILKKNVKVTEHSCITKGDDHCKFRIKVF